MANDGTVKIGTELDDSGFKSGLSKRGSVASSALKGAATAISGIGTAAAGAVGGLLALESATEEYRIAQGKLNTAFEAAGYGPEVAAEAYNRFYGILGDTDTATEASQLLAKLARSEEDVATWADIAAGVSGTFGDALPVESLIESANETAKVGQVTGILADALNWAGISEDEFNAKLAAAGSEAERNQLIMDTLSGTYEGATEAFYKNNEAIVASRENQAQLDKSLAKVGESVSNVKNAFVEKFSPTISEAAEYAADFISNVDPEEVTEKIESLISTFETLLPVITGVTAATVAYKAAVSISAIIDALTKATEGTTLAQAALNAVLNANPFVLVATLVGGLVTALVTLWNTNEGFRDAVKAAWETVKSSIENAVKNIKEFFTKTIPEAAQKALDWFEDIPEKMKQVGKDLLEGLWNGISDKVAWLKGKVSGVVDTIKGWFTGKKGFDEHSPSKWSEQVGKYVDDGLAKGLEKSKGAVKDAAQGVINETKRIGNNLSVGTAVSVAKDAVAAAQALMSEFIPSAAARVAAANSAMAPVAVGSVNVAQMTGGNSIQDAINKIGSMIALSNAAWSEKELVINLNGREMARALLRDLRMVSAQSPSIKYN